MTLITGTVLPNNGDRIKAENYNDPINKILAVINGGLDASNITPGSLPWESMAAFTNKIPAAAMQDSGNLEKYRLESKIAYIASGASWSTLSGLDGAMTTGFMYATNGTRVTIPAITSKTFPASQDTYVSLSTSGAPSYQSVANGATPPALTSGYLWVARVVTNGSAITTISDMRPLFPMSVPTKFSVYRAAALNSSTSPVAVAFDTKLFDTGNDVDTATNKGRFTARYAGWYQFNALVGNLSAANTLMVIQLNINGAIKKLGNVSTPVNGNNRYVLNTMVYMYAGDYAEVAFTGGAGSVIAANQENCYFEGYLVSTT